MQHAQLAACCIPLGRARLTVEKPCVEKEACKAKTGRTRLRQEDESVGIVKNVAVPITVTLPTQKKPALHRTPPNAPYYTCPFIGNYQAWPPTRAQ